LSSTLRGMIILAGAYALGSVPWSVWVARWTRGIDVRTVGSGNPGATNVLRSAGRGPGIAALAGDVLKGVLAVLLARLLAPSAAWLGLAALAAVCGHVFSVFLDFRGGKGVATAAGALGTVSPPAFLVALAVFAVVVGLTRYVSLGSIVAALAFPVALWLLPGPGVDAEARIAILTSSTLIALLVVARHRSNLERLMAGTESRLGRRPEG